MGVIHCCSRLQRSQTFILAPDKNFVFVELDILPRCSDCGHFVAQLTRIDFENKLSIVRKVNQKARSFFEKLEHDILFEVKTSVFSPRQAGSFWLGYNEFGKKKKCFSNLSSMQLGRFDNFQFLPAKQVLSDF